MWLSTDTVILHGSMGGRNLEKWEKEIRDPRVTLAQIGPSVELFEEGSLSWDRCPSFRALERVEHLARCHHVLGPRSVLRVKFAAGGS